MGQNAAVQTPMDVILRDPVAGLAGGIGFVGLDLPIDVFAASGRPFGHLPWHAGATPWADRWLESGFPGWSRALLEDWQAGRFDGIGQVVFSRADDASQRLYYYVRELQRRGRLAGPVPLMFDIALLPRETSLVHTQAAVRSVAEALGVAEAAMAGAIAHVNALRSRLMRLQEGRQGDGAVYERLARAVLFSDATRWLGEFLAPAAQARAGVLLAGSVPPDDRLHRSVEAGGASVVGEAHALNLARLGPPAPEGSPWHVLAHHLRTHSVAPRAVFDRAAWLVARARAVRATAVLLWLTREEESLLWHVPSQRRALEAAGLPCLALTARSWTADDGAPEEIAAFCRELSS